jgi:hypothetical protein
VIQELAERKLMREPPDLEELRPVALVDGHWQPDQRRPDTAR